MESLITNYDTFPENSIPETVIKTVKNRLLHNTWNTVFFDNGTVKAFPDAKFGNAVYGHRSKIRAMAYQAKLAPMLQIDAPALLSNSIFFTGTTKYLKNSTKGTREALERVKKQWPKFIRKARKLGVKAEIHAFECHRDGGCHVHAVLVFDHSLKFFRDHKGKARHAVLNDKLRELWEIGEVVDVQGLMSEKAAGYVLKELAKSYACEKAIKRLEDGEQLKKNDANRIWLTWLVDQTGCRTLGHSENLSISDEEIEEVKEAEASRLDSNRTNSTDPEPEILGILTFTPQQVRRWKWWKPYTGKVDPDSEMYRQLWELCPQKKSA